MFSKREIGAEGEDRAVRALKKRGYRIVETNYRTRTGEIDIIAEEKDYLVFVEVKRRNSTSHGDSLEAVDKRKKDHMIRTAMHYLKAHKCSSRRVRFDVVGIDGDTLKIVQHAFIAE